MWTYNRLISSQNKIPDAINGSPIEIASIFTMFYELAAGNVAFHLLTGVKEVIFAMNFSGTAGT